MIRPANANDISFLFKLYMHPQVNAWLLYEPMSPEEFEPVFKDLLVKKILYIYEKEGSPAGMFKLVPQTHRNEHIVYLGGLAIDPVVGGKGQGYIMLQEILAYAGKKGFLRMELSVATTNERAIRMYERAGFQKEGVLRKFTYLKKEDRWLDEFMMAYLYPR
jgi:putative acetyltransferase